MTKKIKKLKHRNFLVAIVMKKSVRKHKDKKREAKNKGYDEHSA